MLQADCNTGTKKQQRKGREMEASMSRRTIQDGSQYLDLGSVDFRISDVQIYSFVPPPQDPLNIARPVLWSFLEGVPRAREAVAVF